MWQRKPTKVEAWQYGTKEQGPPWLSVAFLNGDARMVEGGLLVRSYTGEVVAAVGSWIVMEGEELFVYENDAFREAFEAAGPESRKRADKKLLATRTRIIQDILSKFPGISAMKIAEIAKADGVVLEEVHVNHILKNRGGLFERTGPGKWRVKGGA